MLCCLTTKATQKHFVFLNTTSRFSLRAFGLKKCTLTFQAAKTARHMVNDMDKQYNTGHQFLHLFAYTSRSLVEKPSQILSFSTTAWYDKQNKQLHGKKASVSYYGPPAMSACKPHHQITKHLIICNCDHTHLGKQLLQMQSKSSL